MFGSMAEGRKVGGIADVPPFPDGVQTAFRRGPSQTIQGPRGLPTPHCDRSRYQREGTETNGGNDAHWKTATVLANRRGRDEPAGVSCVTAAPPLL